MSSLPKVSVFTATKNGGRFLVDTIESVLNQTFQDYEHVIVDGASTDNTLEILGSYPHLRWISEPDGSATEGFHKALRMCRGEYLFQCCVSDGFLDREWFETCVAILDRNPDISMVYGLPQYMDEDGHLGRISYSEFFDQPPPQKEDFLPFWLATRFIFPEGNYCVRREVFQECFSDPDATDELDRVNPFLRFVYNFNAMGYLPFFVPLIANYGRIHRGQLTQQLEQESQRTIDSYVRYVDEYKRKLIQGQIPHVYRNGKGDVIGDVYEKRLKLYRRQIMGYSLTHRLYFKHSASSSSLCFLLGGLKRGRRFLRAFLGRLT
jgi:glycosyltransferase involved in cell wall biosynthesis